MRRQIVIMLLGLMTILSLPAFAIAGSRESSHATQPYKYIGKELDRTHGLDWQTIGDSVRSYRYQYDGLGRLTSADYLESGHSSDRYVTEYSYDLMGNILTLSRSGKVYDDIYGVTDDLTYQSVVLVAVTAHRVSYRLPVHGRNDIRQQLPLSVFSFEG